MVRSMRLAATVMGLLFIARSLPASGQSAPKAQPFFLVQASGKTQVFGSTPAQIRQAYGFDQVANQGAGQTITIVDAFDHPTIEADLAVFTTTFNLPACTSDNGCFKKVHAGPSLPRMDPLWAFEIALDVEWAHAIAPAAKILLVEADSDKVSDLIAAVNVAVLHYGANIVSMSWGALEFQGESDYDVYFSSANATFLAASGDLGHVVVYPSASPYVVSIGGSTLHVNANGSYQNENAWSSSGGGLSSIELAPPHQMSYPIPNNPLNMRGTPDVAYVGDPNTGVAIYDSIPYSIFSGWSEVGGTSVGPPQWAALFAIANSERGNKSPLLARTPILYDAATPQSSAYHDLTQGRNSTCKTLCKAQEGYDYVTGLGSPQANNLIDFLRQLP